MRLGMVWILILEHTIKGISVDELTVSPFQLKPTTKLICLPSFSGKGWSASMVPKKYRWIRPYLLIEQLLQ